MDSISRQQDLPPYEVIVVSNGSTDGTAKIAQDAGCITIEYPNEHAYAKIAYARQKGLELARGNIIATTDCDTMRRPTAINKLINPILRGEAMCTTGGVEFLNSPLHLSALVNLYDTARTVVDIATNFVPQAQILQKASGANMAFLRDSALSIGGYNINMSSREDTNLLQRIGEHGRIKFVRDPEAVIYTPPRRLAQFTLLQMAGYIIAGSHIKRTLHHTSRPLTDKNYRQDYR